MIFAPLSPMGKKALREFVSEAIEAGKITVAELSRRSGVGDDAIRSLLKRPNASMNAEAARDILAALDLQYLFMAIPSVPIVGRVGAGALVSNYDAYADDYSQAPQIYCPPGLDPDGLFAVEVKGDSMAPLYEDGDVLLFNQGMSGIPTELLGRKCICEDDDGNCWVKVVNAGSAPGLFHLISLNPTSQNRYDVRLQWASRVLQAIPSELKKLQSV